MLQLWTMGFGATLFSNPMEGSWSPLYNLWRWTDMGYPTSRGTQFSPMLQSWNCWFKSQIKLTPVGLVALSSRGLRSDMVRLCRRHHLRISFCFPNWLNPRAHVSSGRWVASGDLLVGDGFRKGMIPETVRKSLTYPPLENPPFVDDFPMKTIENLHEDVAHVWLPNDTGMTQWLTSLTMDIHEWYLDHRISISSPSSSLGGIFRLQTTKVQGHLMLHLRLDLESVQNHCCWTKI